MDFSEKQKLPNHRLLLLFLLVLTVLLLYAGVMFSIQIVHGEEYRQRSVSQIVRSTTVEAARGDITDRNGNLMVGNRHTYTLTFDASLLPKDVDQNEAVLRLVDLCIESNVAYTDHVPLSQTAPFTYVELSETQQKQFDRYRNDLIERLEKEQSKRKPAPDSETQDKKKKRKKEEEPLTEKQLAEQQRSAFLNDPAFDPNEMTAPQLMAAMRWDFKIDPSVSDADARKIVAVRYELALRKIYNTTAYVLAEDVDIDLITRVKDGDYYGAVIGNADTRQYMTTAAAHILGHVGKISPEAYQELKDKGYSLDATVGRDGVEAAFESYLHGVDGKQISNTNDAGKVTSELYIKEPQPGNTVELTVDLPLQEATEALLEERISALTQQDHIPRGGAAVVVEVGTGEVLAMASYPTFDLSTFSENFSTYNADPSSPLLNRATMGAYAPGSTFKPLTAIAGLESGIISPSTIIHTKGIYTYYKDYQPRCWIYRQSHSTHGDVDVRKALEVSCNYFFYDVGRQLGIEKLDDYARQFGLGEKTGIEIPERTGILAGPAYSESQGATWYPGNTLQAAIGQSDHMFTPLQLANYTATLASGGAHYPAHLLKQVHRYDNSEILYDADPEPLNTVEIHPENLQAVFAGMHDLTTKGSVASSFKDCPVEVAAKTGSAQTSNKTADGAFIAFAPYEKPEIAVAVVIEKAGAGSALAPVAAGIITSYFTKEPPAKVITGENQPLP